MKRYLSLVFLLIVSGSYGQKADYHNTTLSIDQRVDLLISKMTIEEKAAQLCHIINAEYLFDAQGNIEENKVSEFFPNGIGSISFGQVRMPIERAVNLNNAFQKLMVEKTRHGIPSTFIGEGLHGFMAIGSTVFPQAIALGCTWDTALIERVFRATAKEMRTRGIHVALSPVLDLARDPRWGRIEETYSEDPYLTARIGKAAVLGFQGHGPLIDDEHVVSTLKHFAGHGQGEGGNNTAPVLCDERYFRENHLYPFEIAVKEARVKAVMPSYNEWSGIPNHSNPWLLKTVLRGEWGFSGNVISDQGGIEDLYRKHCIVNANEEAAAIAIKSGIDSEIMDAKSTYQSLPGIVKSGLLSEKELDIAVKNVLLNKFRLGLFQLPYADLNKAKSVTNCKEHKDIALQAAREAIVLLKNENHVLPINETKIKTLAVIGPNAAEVHFGGYSIEPRVGISVLDGIKDFARGKFNVTYAEGCKITTKSGSFWDNDNTVLNNESADLKLISEAVEVARKSDIVLLVIGENESICREAWSENHRGDRDDLNLFGRQDQLVKEIIKTGKPIVVLLINGRPITINYVAENVPAILEGWYLGQETGTAVADVLFGKVNPSGKLSVTFPKNIGQLPVYYSKKPSRNRNYVNSDMTPLFPFGFGLSYTTFTYSKPAIEKKQVRRNEINRVSMNLKNTGNTKGEEIVQLYIRDKVSSVVRPVMELKDFARVSLNPGESKEIEFIITPEKLQFYNREMNRVVEPGEFEVFIGSSSVDLSSVSFWVTE